MSAQVMSRNSIMRPPEVGPPWRALTSSRCGPELLRHGGLLHHPQKGHPGGSGRGVQQDKTPPVPGDGGGLGLSAFCDCQVSRTRIAYHLHRRKGCTRASNCSGCSFEFPFFSVVGMFGVDGGEVDQHVVACDLPVFPVLDFG